MGTSLETTAIDSSADALPDNSHDDVEIVTFKHDTHAGDVTASAATSADSNIVVQDPNATPGSATLSLADLERLTQENNPTLVAAHARLLAANGGWLQAGLYPNPVGGYHATEINNRDTAGQQGGFLSQRVITAGKLRKDRVIAVQQIRQAEANYDTQRLRVLNDLKLRYYDVLTEQRRAELARELVRIGKAAVDASQKLLQGRLVPRTDLLQAQIEADSADILLEQARNQLREAWTKLAAITGLANLQLMPLTGRLDGELPSFQWEERLQTLLATSPELAAAEAGVGKARATLNRENVEWIPNVDASLSFRRNNITGSDNANVQIGIPIPIYDRNQGNILRAEADLVAAKSRIQTMELDLQRRLAAAFRKYANARFRVEKYTQRILPNAKDSLALVTKGYEERQIDYLTLLTAQRTYFQVNLAYLNALRELRHSVVVLDGQLLTESLQQR